MASLTVPVEAERVLKQAALSCATQSFEDDSKEGIAQLTALLQKFGINTKAKKPNTMPAAMLRACVTRGVTLQAKSWVYENSTLRLGLSPWICMCTPIQFLYTLNLMYFISPRALSADCPWWDLTRELGRSRLGLVLMSVEQPST